jgi:hypothetical protein
MGSVMRGTTIAMLGIVVVGGCVGMPRAVAIAPLPVSLAA